MLFCRLRRRKIVSHSAFDDLELNYAVWLPSDRNAAIVDVGCGDGRVLAFLAAAGYTHLEGFDRDPAAVEAARARVNAQVVVEHDWARFLDPRPRAVDLVVLKDVIYYVPKDGVVEALRTVRRAIKPGGRVLVEVFNGASFTGPFVAYKDDGILWVPTEHTVRTFLERAGFVSVELRAHIPPARTLRRRAFNLLAAVWRGVLRLIYLAERGLSEGNPRILTTKIVAVGTVPS